jgi:hypothetical protein
MAPTGVTVGRSAGVLHVHSTYSHDGHDTLEELREWALGKAIHYVWLTDHAEDFTSERFAEFVGRCGALSDARVALVPGLEFRFRGYTGLHLLAVDLRSWIAPTTPGEFVALAPSVSALTVVAHPGLARYRIPEEVRSGIGAIEIWNGAYNTRYLPDPIAMRLVRELRRHRPEVVGTAGLDQHDRANDRELRIDMAGDVEDATAALVAGRYTNRGRTMTIAPDCELSPLRLAALDLARTALDGVERLQIRITRWQRALRARPGSADHG